MLGGLVLGLIEAFWSGYFSIQYKDVAAFGILVVVLIFLPTGLLGKPEIETLSTLFGGFLYGWLDWRSGSVLWSGLTHTYILSLAILVSGAMASG